MNNKTKFIIGMTALGAAGVLLAGCGEAKLYKIIFVSDSSESIIAPIEVEWGKTPTLPDNPVKTGYTFAGWFTNPEKTNPYVVGEIESEMTLYAKWNINSYTLSFVTGTTETIAPVTQEYGSVVEIKNDLKRDYYLFGGWYEDQAFTKPFSGKMPASNSSLYAKWIANKVTFSFDKNAEAAVGEMTDWSVQESDISKALPKCTFTYTGKDFLGWATSPDGEVIYQDGQDIEHVVGNENAILYAKWTDKYLKAEFFTTDIYGDQVLYLESPEAIKYGDLIVKPAVNPSLEGYAFAGWGRMERTEDINAAFKKQYFKKLGDSDAYSKVKVSEGENISSSGYYEVKPIALIDTITISDDNKFYACFERGTFKIDFIDAITGDVVASNSGLYGAVVSLPEIPIKDGYTATGWFTDEECNIPYLQETVTYKSKDSVFYLGYSQNTYSLTYFKEDMINKVTIAKHYQDLLDLPELYKEGYHFEGWSIDENGKTMYLLDTMPNDDLTLYPVFSLKEFVVKFFDGDQEIDSKEYKFGAPLNLKDGSKEGYSFQGWYTDPAFDPETEIIPGSTMPDLAEGNELKLYGKFVAHKHSVTFETGLGTVVEPRNDVEYGSKLVAPENPVKAGYVFDGWAEPDGKKFNFETSTMPDYDLQLHAIWVADDVEVTVSFFGNVVGKVGLYEPIGSPHSVKVSAKVGTSFTAGNDVSIEGFSFKSSESITVEGGSDNAINVYYSRNSNYVSVFERKGQSDIAYQQREYGESLREIPGDVFAPIDGEPVLNPNFEIDGKTFDATQITNVVSEGNTNINLLRNTPETGKGYLVLAGNKGLLDGAVAKSFEYSSEQTIDLSSYIPERDGYTFAGWYDAIEEGNLVENSTISVNSSLTLYAHWDADSVTTKFNNAYDESVPSQITDTFGELVSLASPVRSGYTFKGWKDHNSDAVIVGDCYKLNNDYTEFDAQWAENKITVCYHGNFNTEGAMEPSEMNFSDLASHDLRENAFKREGYVFLGWALTPDATSAVYDEFTGFSIPGIEFDAEHKQLDLYAVWSRTQHTIKFFDDPEAEEPYDEITTYYGAAIESPVQPVKEGFIFTGWYDAKEGGNLFRFDTMPAEDVTLYAHWRANSYQVIFDSNGGTLVDAVTLVNGTSLSEVELPSNLEHKGYSFGGWFTQDGTYDVTGKPNNDWGEKVTPEYLSTQTIDGADIIFYAQWVVEKHTITFVVNNGVTWGDSNPAFVQDGDGNFVLTANYGDEVNKPQDPTQGANTFIGWYDADGNYYDFTVNGVMPNEDVVLYPHFDDKTYTLVFKDENGNFIFSVSSGADNPTFMAYIAHLLEREDAYSYVYDAISKAAGNDMSYVTFITTYANISDLSGSDLSTAVLMLGGASETEATTIVGGCYALGQDFRNVVAAAAQALQNSDFASYATYKGYIDAFAESNPGSIAVQVKTAFEATAASGDSSYITPFATACLPDEYLFSLAYGNSGLSEQEIAEAIAIFEKGLDKTNAEDIAYITWLKGIAANQTQAYLENVSNVTSEMIGKVSSEYTSYENNAYNPASSNPNKIFDGWVSSVSEDEGIITYRPEYILKMSSVNNINVYSSSNTSVTFNWDPVADAYGYRIEVYVNDVQTGTNITTVPEYKVSGLVKGDTVRILVTALKKDANGDYRATSKQFSATSLIDGSQLVVPAQSLDSESALYSYIHTVENDIGKITDSGDFYYTSKDDDGNRTYIFFTNTTYNFGGKHLVITSENSPAVVGQASDSHEAIVTSNLTGNFAFTIDGETVFGIVRTMPDSIVSGSMLSKSENTTITNETRNAVAYGSHDFLGEEKETYKISAASDGVVSGAEYNFFSAEGNHYNGVKFDIDTIATTGKKITIDRDYTFYKYNESGEPVKVENAEKLYFYDAENDVFYFNKGTGAVDDKSNLGMYKLIVTPKADVEGSYTNTFIPNAYKKNPVKMDLLKKVFEFELTEGVNIYTSAGLRAAMKDSSVTLINIQSSFEADYDANMAFYVPHVLEVGGNIKSDYAYAKYMKDYITHGELDIKDRTAVMTTDAVAGAKIWVRSEGANIIFRDVNGNGYAYKKNGNYALKSCQYVQNSKDGKFKVISDQSTNNTRNILDPYGLDTAQCYKRRGNDCQPLTINGNYFTVDGSKMPYTQGLSRVTAGTAIATYIVQSHQGAIFANTSNAELSIKALNVVSNSQNASNILDEDKQDVASIMELTSGGLNGILAYASEGASYGKVSIESVNISNAIIAVYADGNFNTSYSHIKNPWANGIYTGAQGNMEINVDHTVIENCGGCAIHLDDQGYTFDSTSSVTNPKLHIDYANCDIQNWVSGDEQWFKAYSMEVVALGLKSKVNEQVAAMGYSVIQERKNPATGYVGEYMNWVFFSKSDNISEQPSKNAKDIGAEIYFGADSQFTKLADQKIGALPGSIYIETKGGAPVVDEKGQLKALFLADVGVQEGFNNPASLMPNAAGRNAVVVELVLDASSYSPVAQGKSYLYFRMQQAPIGYIQGMLELFPKA